MLPPDRREFGQSEEGMLLHRQSLPPVVVARATSTLMTMYFNEELPDTHPARRFFGDETLPLLRLAQRGLMRNRHAIDRAGALSAVEYNYLLQKIPASNGNTTETEDAAFQFALVAFVRLSILAQADQIPGGFLTGRSALGHPTTTIEFLNRLQEMKQEVGKIINGQTSPKNVVEASTPLLRTYTFFAAGKDIPLQTNQPRAEKREIIERVENLLGGIQIGI